MTISAPTVHLCHHVAFGLISLGRKSNNTAHALRNTPKIPPTGQFCEPKSILNCAINRRVVVLTVTGYRKTSAFSRAPNRRMSWRWTGRKKLVHGEKSDQFKTTIQLDICLFLTINFLLQNHFFSFEKIISSNDTNAD